MVAITSGTIVAQFWFSPKAIFTGLAMIALCVSAAFAAFVRVHRTNGVTVTLTLRTGSEVPPAIRQNYTGDVIAWKKTKPSPRLV